MGRRRKNKIKRGRTSRENILTTQLPLHMYVHHRYVYTQSPDSHYCGSWDHIPWSTTVECSGVVSTVSKHTSVHIPHRVALIHTHDGA